MDINGIDFNKVHKRIILDSVGDLSKAPSWIMEIVNKEKEENNKLININGYVMETEDGLIVYEVFALCFAHTFSTMNIYKAVKWHTSGLAIENETIIDKVWVSVDELKLYMEEIKEVSFSG